MMALGIRIIPSIFIIFIFSANILSTRAQTAPSETEVREALDSTLAYYAQWERPGGFANIYSLETGQSYGTGTHLPMTDTEVFTAFSSGLQTSGTAAVGFSYLRAYLLTQNPAYLDMARSIGISLAFAQTQIGGWNHISDIAQAQVSPVVRPLDPRQSATFWSHTTPATLSFLMDLDQIINEDWLTDAIQNGLLLTLTAQFENGAWNMIYPSDGEDGYTGWYAFNDETIPANILILLKAYVLYGEAAYLEAAIHGGQFILASQLPEPTPGWADQYNYDLQPAQGRPFEPPAVSARGTAGAVRALIQLYFFDPDPNYLNAIVPAINWLEQAEMSAELNSGTRLWARYYEPGNPNHVPIYLEHDGSVIAPPLTDNIEDHHGHWYIPQLIAYWRTLETALSADVNGNPQLEASVIPAALAERLRQPDDTLRQIAPAEITALAADALALLDNGERWVSDITLPDGTLEAGLQMVQFTAYTRRLLTFLDPTNSTMFNGQFMVHLPPLAADMLPETRVNQGQQLLEQGRPAEAIEILTSAIANNPERNDAYLYRGRAYRLVGENELALSDLQHAVNAWPDEAYIHYDLAMVYLQTEDLDNALRHLDQALQLRPDKPHFYYARGYIHAIQGDYGASNADLQHAVELEPWHAFARLHISANNCFQGSEQNFELVASYMTRQIAQRLDAAFETCAMTDMIATDMIARDAFVSGDMPSAVYHLSLALESEPANADLYVYQAMAHISQDKLLSAFLNLSHALDLSPENVNAHEFMALIYDRMLNGSAALQHYSRAAELGSSNPLVVRRMAELYAAAGNNVQAVTRYAQLLDLDPSFQEDATIYEARGWLFQSDSDWNAALLDYDAALTINSQNPLTSYRRGEVHQALRNWEASVEDFTDVLQIEPENTMALWARGRSQYFLQRYEDAIADFSRVIQEADRNEQVIQVRDAMRFRGESYEQLGDYELALADYSQLIEFIPRSASGYISRGRLYAIHYADLMSAQQDFDEAIKLAPNNANVYLSIGSVYDQVGDTVQALANYHLYLEYASDPPENILNRVQELEAAQNNS